jgi:far upstream element-binding protein
MSYSGGYGGDSSTKMKVESADVGKIIGRGGMKIREMETVCGVKIKIDREADGDGMKGVEICGPHEDVEKARGMIDGCLSGADFDGGRRGGGSSYGSRGRGSGGGAGGYGGRRGDSRGDGGSYGRRDRDGGDGWGRRDDRGNDSRGSRGGGGGGRGYSDSDETETVVVESSEVGRIIGRGGQRIKEMEECSGCRIKVNRDDGRGHSSVDLIGSKSAISTAKGLISDAGVEFVNGDDRGRGW